MSYSVLISNSGGGSNAAYAVTVRLETEQTGVFTTTQYWRVAGKAPPGLKVTPFREGWGYWTGSIGDMVQLLTQDKKTMLVELRRASGPSGPAYDSTEAASIDSPVSWQRVATPGEPGLWAGIAGKAGGEVGVGAEALVGVVVSALSPSQWFVFSMGSLRGGAAAGVAGGLSLVVWTGIRTPGQVHGSIQGGSDWAVSLGAKWGAVAKNITKVKELEDLGKRVNFCLENADKFITAGKGVYQEACLDYGSPNLLVVDTPAGAGVELGYYWWVGAVSVMAQGTGVPTALIESNRAISQAHYRPRRI